MVVVVAAHMVSLTFYGTEANSVKTLKKTQSTKPNQQPKPISRAVFHYIWLTDFCGWLAS